MSASPMYTIPEEFRRLDPPLSDGEKMQIRQRIDPWKEEAIHLWNGRLLMEQDKLRLCMEEGIPTRMVEHAFPTPTEARIWVLRYSLEHRSMTECWRYWLLGRLYGELQKQEQRGPLDVLSPEPAKSARLKMMVEYDITNSSLNNYTIYARGIQRFYDLKEELAMAILQEKVRVSINNMRILVRMEDAAFRQMVQLLEEESDLQDPSQVGMLIESVVPTMRQKKEKVATIKDMPQYDPEAEIMSLSLTLPIWTRQMERARNSSDFRKISRETAASMEAGLVHHRTEIQHFLRLLRKAQDYGNR